MTQQIINASLQLVEGLICFFFYESICDFPNRKIKRFFAVEVSYSIISAVAIFLNFNLILNSVILMALYFCLAVFVYKIKWTRSLFYSILSAIIIGLTKIAVFSAFSAILSITSTDYLNILPQYIIMVLISKAMLFIFFKITSDIINKSTNNQKVSLSFFIYPASLLIVLIDFSVILNQPWLSKNMNIIISVSCVILILSVILTCIFQQSFLQKEQELIQLKALKQTQRFENEYFKLLEHQNDELQTFVHDMKKHLGNIYNLIPESEEAKLYITQLGCDLLENDKYGKISNKLLDVIVNKYDYLCKKEQIEFEKNIHSSNLSFMADNDITAIFNNLLDNAIDAAKNSNDKKISFSINSVGNLIMIELNNSCDALPVSKSKVLITTKKDFGLHGYGFKSIARAVRKYNGDLEWNYDENTHIFRVSLIFAMDKIEKKHEKNIFLP